MVKSLSTSRSLIYTTMLLPSLENISFVIRMAPSRQYSASPPASGSMNPGWKSFPYVIDTTSYFKSDVAQSNFYWIMVPINYSNEDGDQAALVVLKLPVQFEIEYKGAILMNPGGPDGRVVEILVPLVPHSVRHYQLRSSWGRQFNTSGRDFPLQRKSRWSAIPDHWIAVLNTQHPTIPRLWAFGHVITKVAEEREKGFTNYIVPTTLPGICFKLMKQLVKRNFNFGDSSDEGFNVNAYLKFSYCLHTARCLL
ncbi:hypothetical protein EDD18DRAFT_1337355 [Armillaria luteobubalina]|uniref:Uncharacterized protein n=1 Tax=Armillaria luteobubalina TaxID=153913 RepID=A0AA39P914_9AGAR|nr:hypothetical protein EDD18DRAFT_1337355 [Armillaria luteobubalina]